MLACLGKPALQRNVPPPKFDALVAINGSVVGWQIGHKWISPTYEGDGLHLLRPQRFYPFDLNKVGNPYLTTMDPAGNLTTQKGVCQIAGRKPKFPRRVKELKVSDRRAVRLLQKYLDKHEPGAKAHVKRVLVTDLDGDGITEMLVEGRHPENAENVSPGYPKKGEYAALLIFTSKGKSIPIQFQSMHAGNGMEKLMLTCIADIDNDGRMEIMTSSRAYESWDSTVWSYRKGVLKELLYSYGP